MVVFCRTVLVVGSIILVTSGTYLNAQVDKDSARNSLGQAELTVLTLASLEQSKSIVEDDRRQDRADEAVNTVWKYSLRLREEASEPVNAILEKMLEAGLNNPDEVASFLTAYNEVKKQDFFIAKHVIDGREKLLKNHPELTPLSEDEKSQCINLLWDKVFQTITLTAQSIKQTAVENGTVSADLAFKELVNKVTYQFCPQSMVHDKRSDTAKSEIDHTENALIKQILKEKQK